jgi:NTP pyrophosphatase (non-canonical NTP hydrolase)
MNLQDITVEAINIKELYAKKNKADGNKAWGVAEFTQGFVGDAGDLVKLIMAKEGYRHKDNIDEKIAHELADCLWSILIIANELNIDLEEAFEKTMKELKEKLQ